MIKKIIGLVVILIVSCIIFFYIKNDNVDYIKYEGKKYILLDYNIDIFTYYYNGNDYLEEDRIHPIKHDKYDVVYFNGDLFVLDKQVKDAIKYYKDDNNYDWFIIFDDEDNEIKKSISISDSEFKFLYDIENNKNKDTIIFDDIEMFGSIQKVSKDNLIQGIITLAKVNNHWVYKTEVMTDDDREYVIKIIDSLNDKINNLYLGE